MNIGRFSLLSALAYLLRCNGVEVNCLGLLLNRLAGLSPVGTYAEIELDAFACQKQLSHLPPIPPPKFPLCVPECNAHRNPNAFQCMQGCWSQEPIEQAPACISLLSDLATLAIPETKVTKAVFDGIDFIQCVNQLLEHLPHPGGGGITTTTTTTTSTTTTSSCSSTIAATITCSPGDVQPTVVPCSCCFQNLCSEHPIQCGCLCSCTT